MQPVEKQRQKRDARRSGYAGFETGRATVRKGRPGNSFFLMLLLLAALFLGVLGGYLSAGPAAVEETGDGGPSEEQAPERADAKGDEQETRREPAVVEEPVEAPPPPPLAPQDPTLYLTIPRLGVYGHVVRNDDSEAALDLGAIKLPESGFPWEGSETNTYIA